MISEEKVEEKKICHNCFKEIPISGFRRANLKNGGFHIYNRCIECNNLREKYRYRKYISIPENREHHRKHTLEYNNKMYKNNPNVRERIKKNTIERYYKNKLMEEFLL